MLCALALVVRGHLVQEQRIDHMRTSVVSAAILCKRRCPMPASLTALCRCAYARSSTTP